MVAMILAALVFSPFAFQSGDANFASMRGVVTTGWPSYKPVPNALVVVSGDVDRQETRADAQGRYSFLTLLPGTYRLTIASPAPATALLGLVRHGPVNHVTSANALCFSDDPTLVELSAGLAYFANIDVFARCLK
jgi:hypothetical protein